jgi:hypothetical protein
MASLIEWTRRHPSVLAWLALSLAMVAVLVWEARDQNLMPNAWIALVVATVLVAGACVWIVNWE